MSCHRTIVKWGNAWKNSTYHPNDLTRKEISMQKAKGALGKMAAMALLIVTLLSLMVLPVSAATSSDGTSTQTIEVTTHSNRGKPGRESITLSQSKGTRTHAVTKKQKARYGKWKVSYVNVDDPTDCGSVTLSGSSVKVKLGRDKTYTVTVEWDTLADLGDATWYGPFTENPTWWVSSSCKADYS